MRRLQQLLITLLTCLPLALAVPPPQWRDGRHQAVSPSFRRSLKEENATVYECQDMVLGINTGFFDVLNSIRANHGAAPVEMDHNLTVAAKAYLTDNNVCSNQFAPPPYFNETESVIGLGMVLLGDLLASNWRCVQVLNQWFLTARDYDYDNPFESKKPAADPETYVKLAFTTMIWNSTELVGCAMIDCPQPKHVEVMCMFKESSGYLPTFENLGPSQNELIAEHINPPADKCPSPYSSKIGDTAESVGDKYNLTAVDVTCFGRQIGPFVQIGLGSVPLSIPCTGMAPKTCSEYDFVNNILPTTYIVTPDDTFSSVGQRFGLSGDDICCYNGYYNISLFKFCNPPALENYNSIITIPSPKDLKDRGCNAESLKHNGKPWECPDVPDFMYIMNQYRAANGLSNMTWDDRLQTEVLEYLNRNPVACDNPFAVNTPNGVAIMPSSSNTETKCSAALTVIWGYVMDQSSAFELWERPEGFEYENQASPYTKLLGKNATATVGCGLMTCNPYMTYIFCLFDETNELNNGQPIESNDADAQDWQLDLGKPKDCPTYVFTAEGQTIQEVAAESNVTVQQLVCYGETFRDMDAFRVKFSYGFPVLIPCKDALPKDVTCNTWKWYKGQCGGNYITLGGDTMQGVASRYLRNPSDPTSNMTSAELCCFNRGKDALKNEGNCILEPAHILRIPCSSDLEQSGCRAVEFQTQSGEEDSGSSNLGVILGVSLSVGIGLLLLSALLAFILMKRKDHGTKRSKSWSPYDKMGKAAGLDNDKYSWDLENRRESTNSIIMYGMQNMGGKIPVVAKFFKEAEAFEHERKFYAEKASPDYFPEWYDAQEKTLENLPYLIMERGDYTLREFLKKPGNRGQKAHMKAILMDLGESIRLLHNRGIVHLDLKPENIMFFTRTHRWKCIDFGTWAPTDSCSVPSYSLKHSAPEIVQAAVNGKAIPLLPSADMWSFGVIMWECLTGECLYAQYKEEEIRAMLMGDVPFPFEKDPNLWLTIKEEQARRFVSSLLQRQPNFRWDMARAMDNAFFKEAEDTVMTYRKFQSITETQTAVLNKLDEVGDKVDKIRSLTLENMKTNATNAMMICCTFEEVDPEYDEDSDDNLKKPPKPGSSELYKKYTQGLIEATEAPLSLLSTLGQEEKQVFLLHMNGKYIIRMQVTMTGGEEVPVDSIESVTLIPQSQPTDTVTIPISTLDDESDPTRIVGFGIWDIAMHESDVFMVPGSIVEVEITMKLNNKLVDEPIYVKPVVFLRMHEPGEPFTVQRLAPRLMDRWDNAPEWVKITAWGAQWFYNLF